MDIGDVLLRDAQFVWRERRALIAKDAVLLLPPLPRGKSRSAPTASASSSLRTTARETFPLDGRFSCEAVVVSAAHLHAVRLQDATTGRELLLDTRSRGKKQVWVELFQRARTPRDAIRPLPAPAASVAFDARTLQERVRASALRTAAGKLMRGADLAALLQDASDADAVGDQLVRAGVLEPCCCASGARFQGGGDFLYRVNTAELEQLASAADPTLVLLRRDRHQQYHHSQPCLLTGVVERVSQQLALTESASGLEIVQLCVRSGVLNVPTALAVGNELLLRGRILRRAAHSATDSSRFSMDRDSEYVAGAPLAVVADAPADPPPSEDFARFYREHQQLKARYNAVFYAFCAFCVLVLLDGWGAVLPDPVKFALVAGVLGWLTLGDGSTSLHINIRKSGRGSAVTAAFFSSGPGDGPPAMEANSVVLAAEASAVVLVPPQRTDDVPALLPSEPTGDEKSVSAVLDCELPLAAAAASELVVAASAEARARAARVRSFRVAIAQAASMPYEATEVYSDDYLYSVMSVKDRAFGYAVDKVAKCLEWRAQYGVDAISLDDSGVQTQLTSGSMYWYGYDFQHRPILWVRGRLKDWKRMAQRRDAEIRAHVFLLEVGSRELMPPGTTTYTVVTDSAKVGPSQMDLRLMHGLLDTCVAHYPDRVGMVHAGPMTRFLSWVVPMLWPFLPARLRTKVSFMTDCVKDLSKHMKTELIPKHLGGTADHVLRRTPSSDPSEAMDVLFMIEQQKLRLREIVK
ncbi:hypothetical protein PybrP1_003994 [[Pythium] brassicae (nom. inval.)]|nr:hypothetical protein PybrP1_003994 [[Pythium] brassicae (nom. inval.)]